jgi:hypothetical protein
VLVNKCCLRTASAACADCFQALRLKAPFYQRRFLKQIAKCAVFICEAISERRVRMQVTHPSSTFQWAAYQAAIARPAPLKTRRISKQSRDAQKKTPARMGNTDCQRSGKDFSISLNQKLTSETF